MGNKTTNIRLGASRNLLVIVLLAILAILFSSVARAFDAPSFDSYPIDDSYKQQAQQYMAYSAAKACAPYYGAGWGDYVYLNDTSTIKHSNLASDTTPVVPGVGVVPGFLGADSRPKIRCDLVDLTSQATGNQNWLRDYLLDHINDVDSGKFGLDSGKTSLENNKDTVSTALKEGDFDIIRIDGEYLRGIIQNNLSEPSMNQVSWFLLWDNARKVCGSAKQSENQELLQPIVDNVSKKWTTTSATIDYSNGLGPGSNITAWPNSGDKSCSDIMAQADQNINAYVQAANEYLESHPEESEDIIENGQEVDDSGAEQGESEASCEAGFFGFGWIFCPGANLLESYLNGFLSWIDSQLNWTILADNSSDILAKWQDFLTIANVVFVIAFLIMIYSMATSTGLSNYDIKKMLPRLIIVAIAVNISFYICAALVDLSNIAGQGLYSLLAGSTEKLTVTVGLDGAVGAGVLIVTVIVLFLFGGAAIIAIATIFILLYLRQILLTVLVIISPVAFACALLPNVSKWFGKWKDLFVGMLAVYPMFAAVWGASRWVSGVLTSSAMDTGAGSFVPDFVPQLICVIAPALAIVPIFKASTSLMNRAASVISGSAAARGAKNFINSKGRSLAKNNPATRTLARGAYHASIGAANSRVGQNVGFIRRAALGTAQKAGKVGYAENILDNQIDTQSVDLGKSANLGLNAEQLMQIARTGRYTDEGNREVAVDSYRRGAAMAQVAGMMTNSDIEAMLVNIDNQATNLTNRGREREATTLRKAAYDAVTTSGNAMMSKSDLTRFLNADERSGWGSGNAQAAYDTAVSNYAGGLSADQVAGLSQSKHEYLQSKVNGDNAIRYGNSIRQALNNTKSARNMNQSTREQLSGYLGRMDAEIEPIRRQVSGENMPIDQGGDGGSPSGSPSGGASSASGNNAATRSTQTAAQTTQPAPTTTSTASAGGTTTAPHTVNASSTSGDAGTRSTTSQQLSNYQPSRTMPSPTTQQRSPMHGSGYSGGKHFAIDPQTNTRRRSQTDQSYAARHFSQPASSPNEQSAPQTSGQWNQPNEPNRQ